MERRIEVSHFSRVQTLEDAVQLIAREVALDDLHLVIADCGVCQVSGKLGKVYFLCQQPSVPGSNLAYPTQVHLLEAGWRVIAPPVVVEPLEGYVDSKFPAGVAIGAGADHVLFISRVATGVVVRLAHHQAAATGRDVEQVVRVRVLQLEYDLVVAHFGGSVKVYLPPVGGISKDGVVPLVHRHAMEDVVYGEFPPTVVPLDALFQHKGPFRAVVAKFPRLGQLRDPDVCGGFYVHHYFHYEVHLLMVVHSASPRQIGLTSRRVD